MISIADLSAFCDTFVSQNEIDGYLVVVTEKHTANKLVSKAGTQLIATVPSAHSRGDQGMSRNVNVVVFFIVEKEITGGDEVEQLGNLQGHILALEEHIKSQAADGCTIFNFLEESQLNIDPVYREFGGYNGWQLTVVF